MFICSYFCFKGDIIQDPDEAYNQYHKTFAHKPAVGDRPEYFLASLVERDLGENGTTNEIKVYHENYNYPDLPIPEDSMMTKVRDDGCVMLYCLTMYNENFGQILQSVAGCIRSIIELSQKNPIEYHSKKFALCLVVDGFDKIDSDVLDKSIQYNLIDPEHCCDTLLTTNVDLNKTVKREYVKKSTTLQENKENKHFERHSYATDNVAHVFSKVLKDKDLKEMLNM